VSHGGGRLGGKPRPHLASSRGPLARSVSFSGTCHGIPGREYGRPDGREDGQERGGKKRRRAGNTDDAVPSTQWQLRKQII
jgi:hypothetical protein